MQSLSAVVGNSDRFAHEVNVRKKRVRSPLAAVFRLFARIPRVRSLAIRSVCRLEGGQMWSATFRDLMREYYGVHIGLHSYGPCLNPGRLPSGTKIGNYCSIAPGVQILRRNHPVDRLSQHPFFFNSSTGLLDRDTIESVRDNPLEIGHDVWIGQNVIVTSKCRIIGDSSVIAAGSILTSDVPPFAIVAGVPGRVLRSRIEEDLRKTWLDSKWWLKPVWELSRHAAVFTKPMTSESASELKSPK